MSKRTVYVVTDGSYSDYHVILVCEDEATAKAYADRTRAQVEEYDYYPSGSEIRRRVVYVTQIQGNRDEKLWTYDRTEIIPDGEAEECFSPAELNSPGTRGWRLVSSGTDKERTIKSVADKYSEMKARTEGLTV